MLKFSSLSLRRGARELFRDVNFTVHAGQRLGLTGANGTGKSSLFALIRGELHSDSGDCTLPPKTVIAHVAQETPATDKPAIEYVLDGDVELRRIQGEIEEADKQNNGERLASLYEQLEVADGYSATSRAGRLMSGLGFTAEQSLLPVMNFSGGWRMRLNLAQALMCRSDLLLLDEPTNHLDLEAVLWLEEWLRDYPGTLLLISHDRDFIDRVVTHIAHIEQGGITLYTGNYSAFEVLRAEHLANQQASYEKQQREIAHMQSFVARFRAKASKAKQAQSRLKALERMEVISQAHVDSPFDFHFITADKLPSPLLTLDDAQVGYGETTILKKVRMMIASGDRIGLLGHNGAGKSTLIKLLAGDDVLLGGERVEAKDLKVGYFAQHQLEQLDDQASPLLHLQRINNKATEQELRNFLGGFAFNNDQATSPVGPFSGGEKARLVLAMLVYQRPNLLLLDEPTNHLDLEMRHALSIALQEFDGAMVIVSHDRHLLRTVTDTLLLVADGKVDVFDGDLEDYRKWVRDNANLSSASSVKAPGIVQDVEPSPSNATRKQQRQDAAELRRKQTPLRNALKKLENKMSRLTTEKETLHEQLSDSEIYEDDQKQQLKELLAKQAGVECELETVETQWFEVSEELESMDG